MVGGEDGIDDRPGGLDRVLSGEQRAVAGHRVAEESFVGRFFVRLRIEQQKLALVAEELFAGALDAGGESDRGVGRELEAEVVRRAACRPGVREELLRWRLQLDEDLGDRLGQALAGAQVPRYPRPAPRVDLKSRRAQKVSTSESFATPGSSW